jgi:hypothetical protein
MEQILSGPDKPDDATLRRILQEARTIAVVGCSPKPERDSHRVARYLLEQGYQMIPVNPGQREILGQKCYPDLQAIPQAVDIVDVFRRSEHIPPIAEAAAAIGARVLWLQLGIRNDSAADKARSQGLTVVQDACIMVEHRRLFSPRP